MKNIMYFRLEQGEDVAPLRDMALKYFPNVNLYETDIQADDYNEKDVLNYIIGNINAGKYKKLYIKSLSDISENAIETLRIIDELKNTNTDFEIEFKGGNVITANELVNQASSAVSNVLDRVEKSIVVPRDEKYIDYLNVKIECGGKEVIIDLPLGEEFIEKDLETAGIKMDNDSSVKFTVDTSLPDKFKKIIERACEEKGVLVANEISGLLLTYGMELDEEIMAVIEYAKADTTDKVMCIMGNTDEFKFIEGAKSLEEVGRYWVTFDMETEIETEIDKYMDYTALGRDIMNKYEGRFLEGGCVLNREMVDIQELFTMKEKIEQSMSGMQGM